MAERRPVKAMVGGSTPPLGAHGSVAEWVQGDGLQNRGWEFESPQALHVSVSMRCRGVTSCQPKGNPPHRNGAEDPTGQSRARSTTPRQTVHGTGNFWQRCVGEGYFLSDNQAIRFDSGLGVGLARHLLR